MNKFELLNKLLDELDNPQDWEFDDLGEIEYFDEDSEDPHAYAYVPECSYLGNTNFMVSSKATGREGLQAWFIQEACQKVPQAVEQNELIEKIGEICDRWYRVSQADEKEAVQGMFEIKKMVEELRDD